VLWSDVQHSGSLHWQSPIVFNGRLYLHDDAGHLTAWSLPAAGTPTETPTGVPTNTRTGIQTGTPIPGTPTNTRTGTATRTPTVTRTNTQTKTATRTPTLTPTNTQTRTPTNAPAATGTQTPAGTPTPTPAVVVVPRLTDFRGVRRASDISLGPDLGGTGHKAINFSGSTGSAGDTWITVYDVAPATGDEDSVYSSVGLAADILIQSYNNKKGAGLLALFNEGAGQKGLTLLILDSGTSDTLALGAVNPSTGLVTTLATVSLGPNILENEWYRLTMDVAVSGGNVAVTGRVFRHASPADPKSPIGAQITGTLNFSGTRPAGVDSPGEVGVAAFALGVVNSSVANFTIFQ
jgi:hypothetical protein